MLPPLTHFRSSDIGNDESKLAKLLVSNPKLAYAISDYNNNNN